MVATEYSAVPRVANGTNCQCLPDSVKDHSDHTEYAAAHGRIIGGIYPRKVEAAPKIVRNETYSERDHSGPGDRQ